MCWADNVVGQQKDPCVFHLIAAGKPDAPYNCSLVNQTSESLEVDCSEGKRSHHPPPTLFLANPIMRRRHRLYVYVWGAYTHTHTHKHEL